MTTTATIFNPESEGRALYEEDCRKRPTYHDGTPRKSWDQLTRIARLSWSSDHSDQQMIDRTNRRQTDPRPLTPDPRPPTPDH